LIGGEPCKRITALPAARCRGLPSATIRPNARRAAALTSNCFQMSASKRVRNRASISTSIPELVSARSPKNARAMKCLTTIAAAMAFAFASEAVADPPIHYVDGNQLFSDCTDAAQTATGLGHQLGCRMYIAGAVDAYNLLRGGETSKEGCTPRGVSGRQLYDVVVKFLRQNPEMRHQNAGGLVMLAVRNAWCPTKPPAPQLDYK
jgi:hypothetical protein